jgi:hypothetical protein
MRLHKLLRIEDEAASKVQVNIDTQAKAEGEGDGWNAFESNDDWKKKDVYD